tara:strand:- start:1492 stop:3840 length:2349 start_codon:yes stop_codon:yes gene_type:complete
MNFIKLHHITIKKSDGNVMFWDGQYHAQRHPPIEAFQSPDPRIPHIHAPPFAHTGGHGEEETGMPGVGNLIKGKFELEKVGARGIPVWVDEYGGKHYHGIDGVAHHYDKLLKKAGIEGDAIEHIEEAIRRTNADYGEESDNHLPGFGDPRWRQTAISDYQGANEEGNRVHYIDHNGEKKLVTGYTNSHKDTSPYGTFIDSLSVPYQKHLRDIAVENGINPELIGGKLTHFLKYPHISRNLLSYALHPKEGHHVFSGHTFPQGHFKGGKGRAGNQQLIDNIKSMGHNVDRSLDGISAHSGAAHKLPNDFFRLKAQAHHAAGQEKGGFAVAMNEILTAIEESTDARVGERLSEGKPNMNPLQHPALTNTMFKGVHLGHWLSNPQLRQELLKELQGTAAFNKLFGRTTTGSVHQRLMNAYIEHHTGVPDEEGLEQMDFGGYGSTIGTLSGRNGTHHSAGNVYALAMLAGINPEMGNVVGNSMLRDSQLPPELAAKHGVRLRDEPAETTAERRRVLEALHDYLGEAQGHQTRVPLPEELPTQGVTSHSISGGKYQGGTMADFIPYQATYGAPGLEDAASRAPGNTIQPTVNPIAAQPAPRTGGQTQLAKPAQQTAVMQPPTSVNMASSVGVQPSDITQARQAAANMTPEQLQRIAAAGGGNITTPENIERFRSAYSDPNQRFLTEYMKGDTNMSDAQDRIVKALEDVQMKDAMSDDEVLKHLNNSKLSIESSNDVSSISKKLGIAPQDVRLIHNAKGDWMRLTKSFGYTPTIIKVVKASFGGGLDE